MGSEESHIKGPPSLQVQDTLNLFWNLNYEDQMHFSEIFESRETQLRILHQYHKVDIPLPIWNMFAEVNLLWHLSQRSIDRWNHLSPHIKGVAINYNKGLAFCTNKDLVNVDHGDKTVVQIIDEMAKVFPKMPWKPMIEYKGHLTLLEDFLRNGPPDINDIYDHAQPYEHWINKEKPEVPENSSEEESPDKLTKLEQSGQRMHDACGKLQDLLQEERERNIDAWVEEDDSDSSDNENPGIFGKFEQERLDRWNNMMTDLTGE